MFVRLLLSWNVLWFIGQALNLWLHGSCTVGNIVRNFACLQVIRVLWISLYLMTMLRRGWLGIFYVPAYAHVDIRASLRRDLNAIRKLCHSASSTVLVDSGRVLSLALQHLDSMKERESAVSAKAEALVRVHVVEETDAASLADWVFETIDVAGKRDKAHVAAETVSTELMALCKRVLVKRLCCLNAMMLKTQLLRPNRCGSQPVSTLMKMSAISPKSLRNLLWLRRSWRTRGSVWGCLRS